MKPQIRSNVIIKASALGVCLGSLQLLAAGQESDKVPSSERKAGERRTTTTAEYNQERLTSQQFAEKAAIGGQKEIRLSQIALQRSDNSDVKTFAQQMIQDHSEVGRQLMQVARTKGIQLPATNAFEMELSSGVASAQTYRSTEPPPRTLENDTQIPRREPTGRASVQRLRIPETDLEAARKLERLSGTEFDREYANDMRKDHHKTVAMFDQASKSLDDTELKKFAADTLPKLREHTRMADHLATKVSENRSTETPKEK